MARILIVDDDPSVLKVFSMILRQEGREVLQATTGAQALELARAHAPIDVALLDKNLQGESGLDLARDLKEITPDLEFLIVTGYASLESAIETVRLGAFDYLIKPLEDNDILRHKVDQALHKLQLQRDLAVSQNRYTRVFEAASDAILLWEPDSGRIQDANPAACWLYGYPKSELVELTITSLASGDSDTPFDGPQTHQKKDGTPFPVDVIHGSLEDRPGAMRLSTVRDLTERRRAERDREEIEERLRQAQKMEAIGRLAGGVAHDFNNVLVSVMCHADFALAEVVDDGSLKQHLEAVIDAAQKAAGLTRHLLTFSRKRPTTIDILSVNDAIRDVDRLLSKTLGDHVSLRTELDDSVGRVLADRGQLGQVVLNLVVNARDALPDGGTIEIRTGQTTLGENEAGQRGPSLPPGEYATLTVRDDGEGIEPEALPHIFEPFFTTKAVGHGTGLGLATVYGIIQQANGTIEVASEPAKGTAFTVYLPITDLEAVPAQPAATEIPEAPSGAGESILILEDDPQVRAILGQLLETYGYRTMLAATGDEALRLALEHHDKLDLVLADVIVPGVSGLELASRLSARHPELKIAFMSGYPEGIDAVRRTQHGGVTMLEKPFTRETLLTQVRSALAGG